MTREEVKNIIHVMCATYPNYKPANITETIDIWHNMLEEYDGKQIAFALKSYITSNSSGFAPSIGQLTEYAQTISKPTELNELEAWALVSKALRNGTYHAQEEFDKLPPPVQKAVGNPSNLKNWALTDSESVENVIQSNFMRTYRTVISREKEFSKMPDSIKLLITNIQNNAQKAQIETKSNKVDKFTTEKEKFNSEPLNEFNGIPERLREKLNKIYERGSN